MTAVVALSGGIGGAKLALGLDRELAPGALTVVANPGDDFEHLGLTICPDVDTLVYTLAELANPELGWGRRGETWTFMEVLERLGGETWFRLGDGDLAMHVERTRRLAAGEGLAAITAGLASRLGIASRILPATEQRLRTIVETTDGALAFQHYFVRLRCAPVVTGFRFEGAERARRAGVVEAIDGADAIVVCPSNPFISIDPILAVDDVRAALERRRAPLVVVSPVIGGDAVKGPTAKMFRELGLESSVGEVARHYAGLVDGLVIDEADAALAAELAVPTLVTRTLMRDLDDRRRLARETLDFARSLSGR